MNLEMQGYVYPPFKVKPDKALAEQFLRGQGVSPDLGAIPPTYQIFLRGETRGVDLFTDLAISRTKALHGGQRYEWLDSYDWDDELEVVVTVEKITEKSGRSGKIWFADVAFEYQKADGTKVLREVTRLIERE